MRLPRLPIPVAPARQEILASYLTRLATLHGLDPRELWDPISVARPAGRQRDVLAERLAAITGRAREHLAAALPELRERADWSCMRHQPQPGCLRCDARHPGGPVTRLLPHHRYVCTRHRYWIGPPDIDQAATALNGGLDDIVQAQRRHLRLLRRHGPAATYDAVLTGFLFCAHLWTNQPGTDRDAWHRWTRRTELLIPIGAEAATFSASRLFAAVYPEAVSLAAVIAAPPWRRLAAGDVEQRQRFVNEIGHRLGRPGYQPPEHGDAVAHWMKFDCTQPPSGPDKTFPDTREHGAVRRPKTSEQSLSRHDRSAYWFGRNRRSANILLHHRHIRPVLAREWAPSMDGIAATIWASGSTVPVGRWPTAANEQQAAIGAILRSCADQLEQ